MLPTFDARGRLEPDRRGRHAGRGDGLDPENRIVTTEEGSEYLLDVLAVDVGDVNPAIPDGAVVTKPTSRLRALVLHLQRVRADPAASS